MWLMKYIWFQVELHMRYIEIQRALQSRLGELERLCERERSILMGRWKTHSLPARKRTPNSITSTNPNQPSPSSSFNSSTIQCCRPATSTEHLLLYNVVAAVYKFDNKNQKINLVKYSVVSKNCDIIFLLNSAVRISIRNDTITFVIDSSNLN